MFSTKNGITLITSAKCNLNCSFCFLYKNDSFKTFNDNIVQEAWKNKTYIKTVKKVLDKLDIDQKTINSLTFWGGEPLLQLENVNNNIQELFLTFPNLNYCWTSSNFNINLSNVIQLFKLIDKYTNLDFIFNFQISMDSIFYEQGHNLPIIFYKNQMQKLINELNQIKFKHLQIKIYFRSTIDEQIYLSQLNKKEKILEYINNIIELSEYIENLIINKNVSYVNYYCTPTASYPTSASLEDGLEYNKIVKLFYNLNKNFNIDDALGLHTADFNRSLFSSNFECQNLKTNITILPDGCITCCGNNFINGYTKYKESLEEENNKEILEQYNQEQIFTFNPLKLSEKELERKKWFIQSVKNNNITYTTLAMALCDELAQSNQISFKYHYNKELLLRHIRLAENINNCNFYNLHATNLPFLNNTSAYKKYFNGLTDFNYEKGQISIVERNFL